MLTNTEPHKRHISLTNNSFNLLIEGLEINRNSVTLEQVLGEGQFGDVYKGSYRRKVSVSCK